MNTFALLPPPEPPQQSCRDYDPVAVCRVCGKQCPKRLMREHICYRCDEVMGAALDIQHPEDK